MSMAMKSAVRSSVRPAKVSTRVQRSKLVCRADFIGSAPNLAICTSTAIFLTAARFGLAPTFKKTSTAGLKLVDQEEAANVFTNDPAGFTAVDVLTYGAIGHAFGIGIYLGVKATIGL